MKNRKLKEVKLEDGVTVKGATLLTIEEAEKLPKEILAFHCDWWLQSPGIDDFCAAIVDPDGCIDRDGLMVDRYAHARQALEIEFSNLNIGDTFEFAEDEFQIISETKALCIDSDAGLTKFSTDSMMLDANVYECSEVKKIIDQYYKEACFEYGIRIDEQEVRYYTLEEVIAIIRDIPSSSLQNCVSADEIAELIINVVNKGGKECV